ncbi:uncharacterized protein LOC106804525 [Setaria italica]|uniref:uncharacterized protein LOC106804525 n=1 Tax=Setaria italica TaxID=4555 RepID=UPI0007199C86|nr:uncharacterized protein LOC106804525 [Setaria italica]
MFIAYAELSKPYQLITEWQGYASSVPVQPEQCKPSSTQPDDESYLQNPLPENEHVGVDEEAIYLSNEPVLALDVAVCCEKEKGLIADGPEDDEVEVDNDEVEENNDEVEEDEIGEVHYDKDDPAMTVGSKYPNMEVFKVALSQHAIKHEFEFNTVKSAPYRFTAYCAKKREDKCPWRLHASTMEDMSTVMVIILLYWFTAFVFFL